MRTPLKYKNMKELLEHQGESTKYFTEEFYQMFLETREKNARGLIEGWEGLFETDFYLKNSGAYCVFLELDNEFNMQKFDIFIVDGYGNKTKVVRDSYLDKEHAKRVAEKWYSREGFTLSVEEM